ncbi:Chorismate synthase [Anaeromyxobacter dehalogenans 2CP-1]|uniref:Chorismate synthase n=1 Tax=Anaeromyxobacter dehalogenans (strain ATCC BAA-258 / DSM 21875 / 2CP-1) TaxID=455488 RepID=AROC_ANAD2|nr:chorismate synthase [Anaeromyxobacter dehalogenans]B8J8W9.1 RecName: Full=Chorismate synthase; Short=CS; AltName: Full=5-enolpyruvylshikimate-3-phosphate phospholyase [Anaeromyxobacter dehalogenans 2CP-1]ACL63567.1 Chorismate synthase [Anaeromyxobacter dehalogenans 2CP-1]
MTLRYLTAGESHGPALVAIAEGFPAGLAVDFEAVDRDLRRRQKGYGRGGRMKIETDAAQFLAGLRGGLTTGAPIALAVWNKDHENWKDLVSPYARGGKKFTQVRPGHADLAGALKYGLDDARDVLERASARSTAVTVALGALAKALLSTLGVEVCSRVVAIGPREIRPDAPPTPAQRDAIEASDLHVDDEALAAEWRALIDAEKARGGSIGGAFDVYATGLPIGVGSHVHPDRRLDARLAGALCGVQAIRAVEIGDGTQVGRPGYEFHDAIHHDPARGFWRDTNRAGGLEGGMTDGMPLRVRAYMKPIPTMLHPLATVDLATRAATQARYERSDVCAVPAAAVVGEAVVAWELANALLEKFGGDAVEDVRRAVEAYAARIR